MILCLWNTFYRTSACPYSFTLWKRLFSHLCCCLSLSSAYTAHVFTPPHSQCSQNSRAENTSYCSPSSYRGLLFPSSSHVADWCLHHLLMTFIHVQLLHKIFAHFGHIQSYYRELKLKAVVAKTTFLGLI